MDNANNKDEYEAAHAQRGNVLKKINYMGIDKGIDLTILDELVRVLKNIYIYIYGVAKNRYTQYQSILLRRGAESIIWYGVKPTPHQALIIPGCRTLSIALYSRIQTLLNTMMDTKTRVNGMYQGQIKPTKTFGNTQQLNPLSWWKGT